MPLDAIMDAIGVKVAEAFPEWVLHDDLPEALGDLPAVVLWLAPSAIPWPRDASYIVDWRIEVRVHFSRVDLQHSERQIKGAVEPLRKALDRDARLGGACEDSGVMGLRYGLIDWANVAYFGLVATMAVKERVVAGELA